MREESQLWRGLVWCREEGREAVLARDRLHAVCMRREEADEEGEPARHLALSREGVGVVVAQ